MAHEDYPHWNLKNLKPTSNALWDFPLKPKKIRENQYGYDWMEWLDDDKINDGKKPMDENPSSPKTYAKNP